MTGLGALPAGLGEGDLAAAVRSALEPHLPQGVSAGLAVSGGPDSVALAQLAVRARPDVTWWVVHVRHGLRDDAADARTAAEVAAELGLGYTERRATVSTATRQGLEARARDARYAALRAAAEEHDLPVVCVGHTADDRAESVLLNVGRGTGTRGLAGMPAVRLDGGLRIVRPLLRARRVDVHAVAAASGLPVVADPMNHDPDLRRTRVREEVLPALARLSGGPGDPVGLLCRLADLAADDAAALDAIAERHAEAGIVAWGPVRALRTNDLDTLPEAVASRVVRRMLASVRGGLQGLSADEVHAVRWLDAGSARSVSGGVTATCGRGWLAAAPSRPAPLAGGALASSGLDLPELGLRLACSTAGDEPGTAVIPPLAPDVRRGPASVCVADRRGLAARPVCPGDRIRFGGRSAAVAGLLADAGVPRPARALVPLVVDARDDVVWVPGVAVRDGLQRDGFRLWLAPLEGPGYAAPDPADAGWEQPAAGGQAAP